MSGERYIKRSHKTFCVGVSLGAHVCGFMGTYGNELLGDGTKALDRIIALDPAGMYQTMKILINFVMKYQTQQT